MNTTTKDDGEIQHWHIHLELDEQGDPQLIIHKTGERVPVRERAARAKEIWEMKKFL